MDCESEQYAAEQMLTITAMITLSVDGTTNEPSQEDV